MTAQTNPGILKKFRKNWCKFQRTFVTPKRDLDGFVSTILSPERGLENGTVVIERVAFEPKALGALLKKNNLLPEYNRECSFVAANSEENHQLLTAVFSDWIDFLFIPTPKTFFIYADHDEYATFFANTKSNLNRVADDLLAQGFKEVSDYQRTFH